MTIKCIKCGIIISDTPEAVRALLHKHISKCKQYTMSEAYAEHKRIDNMVNTYAQ